MKGNLDDLDRKILVVLHKGPRSTRDLAAAFGVDQELIQQRCSALQRSQKIVGLDTVDQTILKALPQSGRLSTADLAKTIPDEPREKVYRRCLRMEEKTDLLASETAQSSRLLFFFPATGDVLNRQNYSGVREAVESLKTIAAKHPLPRGTQIPPPVKEELRREYRAYLGTLAASVPPQERPRVKAFEGELMRVLEGTTMADVARLIGIRGFHPKERRWFNEKEVPDRVISALSGGALPGPASVHLTGDVSEETRKTRGGKKKEPGDTRSALPDKSAPLAGDSGQLPGDVIWMECKPPRPTPLRHMPPKRRPAKHKAPHSKKPMRAAA